MKGGREEGGGRGRGERGFIRPKNRLHAAKPVSLLLAAAAAAAASESRAEGGSLPGFFLLHHPQPPSPRRSLFHSYQAACRGRTFPNLVFAATRRTRNERFREVRNRPPRRGGAVGAVFLSRPLQTGRVKGTENAASFGSSASRYAGPDDFPSLGGAGAPVPSHGDSGSRLVAPLGPLLPHACAGVFPPSLYTRLFV